MSQRIKFAPNSRFERLSASSFSILIREPLWNSVLVLLFSAVFMVAPWYNDENFDNQNFKYLWWAFNSIFVLGSLYSVFYYEKIAVDVGEKSLVKRKCLVGIAYKTISLNWPSDAYYLNENVYNSYQKITSVWLLAKSEGSRQSKRLIEFTSEEQYKGFIGIFGETFPELQIREWHD